MTNVNQSLINRNLELKNLKYKAYHLNNFEQIPQFSNFTAEQKFEMKVVGQVFPFRSNSYVVEELIDWKNYKNDAMFILTFPQKEMLKQKHFDEMAEILRSGAPREKIIETANRIRSELNPHPAGQLEHNVPTLNGQKLLGIQHKYRETVLFFPSEGQTCHAYCSFCFRWPQFTNIKSLKFAMRDANMLTEYVKAHPEVSDILFTGGDPLIMRTKSLARYVDALLQANIPHLRSIRFGTKSLSYWPYRFLTDPDARDLMDLFRKIIKSGRQVAIMAHFNHPQELSTLAVKEAIHRLRETGSQIRTQSPLLRHINADPRIWSEMWREQVRLGLVPYYMFIVRDTGAQHYFSLPLVKSWQIFREAYQKVSGLARTVRGPSMSAHPGKVQILGATQIKEEKVLMLRFIQGRNPDWVGRPFFAKYNDQAIWLDQLSPAFGEEKFYFE